jgi:hypothetical protein
MRPRVPAFALSAALALAAAIPSGASAAEDFMQRFSGAWIGSGQVLFGAEPRPEFACALSGDPDASKLIFGMTGKCWMGALSAPIHAELRYHSDTQRYYGEFMDGADGSGADIVGNRDGEAISLKLMRGELQGRLAAETVGSNQLKVVIYYRDPSTKSETPVIAMGLTRREVITGSVMPPRN